MVSVYVDDQGAVRSATTDAVIAPAGMSARSCRIRAAQWAAAADALTNHAAEPPENARADSGAEVTPIVSAPSMAGGYSPRLVVDMARMIRETAQELRGHAVRLSPPVGGASCL